MAICDALGFLAYNPSDLIPDGFIWPILSKERNPETSLESTEKGTTFIAERNEDGEIVRVLEKRKQLPASSLFVEIILGKNVTSKGGSLVPPGTWLGTPLASTIGNTLLSGVIQGGKSSATSNIAFHICEAETKINLPITVTDSILETGIIELPFFPLSVFAIVKEQTEIDERGVKKNVGGIQFTDQELQNLGLLEGNPYFRIRGATDSVGQFGSENTKDTVVKPPPKFGTSEATGSNLFNIFEEIIFDKRTFKFRADNLDATGDLEFPFRSANKNDILSSKVKINTNALISSDIGTTIYLTASVCFKRKLRHLIRHKGDIFVTPSPGGIGLSKFLAIGFQVDAWNFQLSKWVVPKNIPNIPNDLDFKISVLEFPDPNEDLTLNGRLSENDDLEVIEGWRMSEGITFRTTKMWTMDKRGILLVDFTNKDLENPNVEIILSANNIEDQIWFNNYLIDNDLKTNNISFSFEELSGVLYDLSEINNSLLFDREKIPYHRKFALSLRDITTKVGIVNLDLNSKNLNLDVNKFDLSDSVFIKVDMSTTLASNTSLNIIGYGGASCDSIDTLGQAAFFPADNPTVGLFVPSGFFLDSFWRIETPFFNDKYNTKTRIYIEQFSGDTLSSFSSVYVRTLPILEGSISLDHNFSKDAFLFYEDVKLSKAISYHKFHNNSYNQIRNKLRYDITGTHIRPPFDHNLFKNVGYSRIIGSKYSEGRPISTERIHICNTDITGIKWDDIYEKKDLLSIETNIENLPFDVGLENGEVIRDLEIDFEIDDDFFRNKLIRNKENNISLYFKDQDVAITDISFLLTKKESKLFIDTRFYKGGPIQFNGDILKNIIIKKISAIVAKEGILSPFFIDSRQISVAIDIKKRLCVFYSDIDNNISMSLSSDEGLTWFDFDGIIRLAQGETANQPYVLKDDLSSSIKLFYVFNNKFLMYRTVNIDDFICEDSFIKYESPESFPIDFDDNLGLEKYSNGGKKIRQSPSNFVDGESTNKTYQSELAITKKRFKDKQKNKKTIRFSFLGNTVDLDQSFEDSRYSVYKNNQGMLKLFIIRNNKLYIKVGSSPFSWRYIAKDIRFHRNFFPEEGSISEDQNVENLEIRNIQTIYNSFSDDVFIFYFHDEMMFVRDINDNIIEGEFDEKGNLINSEVLEKNLDITKNNYGTRPIFLVGRLSDEIRQEKQKNEIKKNKGKTPLEIIQLTDLAVVVPYSLPDLKTFEGQMDVDSEVQPFGFFTKYGYTRLFYIDINGLINGLTLNTNFVPNLDVKLKNII